MATMTQADVIQQLKFRVRKLKTENAELKNENEELNDALSSIYETASAFSLATQEDIDELNFGNK